MRAASACMIAALIFALSGCAKDACEKEPPSFQLDLTSTIRGARSMVVELSPERRRRTFDLGGELDDGATSIAIEVASPGDVTIAVRTFAEAGAMGPELEMGGGRFTIEDNGCNRLSVALTRSGATDAGMDAGPDAGDGGSVDAGAMEDAGDAEPIDAGDAGETDADLDAGDAGDPDAGDPDAGDPDTGEVDTGAPDAGMACVETADGDTVALYRFEGDLTDETGMFDGSVSGTATFSPTFAACGGALGFDANPNPQGWGVVDDDAAFDLATGSIDFWLQHAALPAQRAYGVLSRDSSLDLPGHLTIYVACDGTIVAKLGTVYRCSNQAVAPGVPAYVAVSFGPPSFELFVDGVASTRTDSVGLIGIGCGTPVPCGGASTSGIDGTDNPWIIGASADASTEGMGNNLALPFREGRIDSLRISSIRRF